MHNSLTSVARSLRKSATPSENRLWQQLRSKRCLGLKFYRQYPIDNYVADFCCPQRRIIIEVDGGGHDEPQQRAKDSLRDEYMKSIDFRTLRFWSNAIENNLPGVMDEIQRSLLAPLPRSLSRKGEREEDKPNDPLP
ncbi:MAG: endonuclease domain-containing protein [bacterium]|nr:endonuclease domain-containing protein [bacterium]